MIFFFKIIFLEILQSNNKLKERLVEIDELALQEDETLKNLRDLKIQGIDDFTQKETEYKYFY